MLTLCNCDINYSCKCLTTSTLCKCVTFIYHLECLLSWFAFFKLILKQLFYDIQFLTLISTLLVQMLHTLYIPLSSCCLTLRTLLCLLLVLMYNFFLFVTGKARFPAFFSPKFYWVRLRECWGFDWRTKVSTFALLTVVSLHPLIPEGEVSDSVARWAVFDSIIKSITEEYILLDNKHMAAFLWQSEVWAPEHKKDLVQILLFFNIQYILVPC